MILPLAGHKDLRAASGIRALFCQFGSGASHSAQFIWLSLKFVLLSESQTGYAVPQLKNPACQI